MRQFIPFLFASVAMFNVSSADVGSSDSYSDDQNKWKNIDKVQQRSESNDNMNSQDRMNGQDRMNNQDRMIGQDRGNNGQWNQNQVNRGTQYDQNSRGLDVNVQTSPQGGIQAGVNSGNSYRNDGNFRANSDTSNYRANANNNRRNNNTNVSYADSTDSDSSKSNNVDSSTSGNTGSSTTRPLNQKTNTYQGQR